jgi:hypothetical protein
MDASLKISFPLISRPSISVEKEAISLQKERMKAASNLAGDVNNDATVY